MTDFSRHTLIARTRVLFAITVICPRYSAHASVLSCLETAEARIENLENQVLARVPTVVTNHEDYGDAAPALPRFHHGANHKILQYWSRLRVQMTLPDIDVLSYVAVAETSDMASGPAMEARRSGSVVSFACVKLALETLDHELHQLPITLGTALRTFYWFRKQKDFRETESR
ncbi:hypothetical protein AbraIFM66950_002205 [Aspergillus brasiliensis]|nr:hypothetical protein AbraIFM66950_002205 [Aspergillus brasiliensis]